MEATAVERKSDDNGRRDPPWVMPDWMEQYRSFIETGLGGNSIERCMNLTGEQTWGNVIMAAICVEGGGKVSMLHAMRKAGLLLDVPA